MPRREKGTPFAWRERGAGRSQGELMAAFVELMKIFALALGMVLLAGTVLVVSWDVYRESERHRLLTQATRFRGHRDAGTRGAALGTILGCR